MKTKLDPSVSAGEMPKRPPRRNEYNSGIDYYEIVEADEVFDSLEDSLRAALDREKELKEENSALIRTVDLNWASHQEFIRLQNQVAQLTQEKQALIDQLEAIK